jgi:hypothetical protein
MSWDHFRSLSHRSEWGSRIPQPHYASDAATLKQFPEARVRHLAEHLNSLGRLNIYILASEWGLSLIDVVHWLTALHHEGLFERVDASPYFRVTSSDSRSEEPLLP